MKRKERWRPRKRMRRHLSKIGYWHHDMRSHAAQNAQVHPDLWFLCDGCQQPIPGGKRRFAARYMDTKGRMAALLVGTRNSLVAAKGLIPTLTGSNWHKDCKVCENFTCKPQRLWETAVLKSEPAASASLHLQVVREVLPNSTTSSRFCSQACA